MDYILYVFVFLLGTIVGSFLNVVALRYNTGFSILGRSSCFSCGNKLSWWELLPLVSFIYLGGKCSRCRSKISWQYPLVEFATGILFLLVFLKFRTFLGTPSYLLLTTYYLLIFCILIVITVYDFKHKIIPNGLVYTFVILSFLSAVFDFLNSSYSLLNTLNLLTGPILFVPFFLLWFFSQGKWIGLGDGKLALGIGFLLGISPGISAVVLAFWIGAAVSIVLLGLQKIFQNRPVTLGRLSIIPRQLTIKSEIPFGPFLILATAIVFFWNIRVIDMNTLLNLFT